MAVFAFSAIAQETLQVDITKLSQQELQLYQKLKQEQQKFDINTITPENVDRYAQMGKGLGIAINEGLSAVTTNVEQFAQTGAGKWLMILITWKVMGDDAIGLTRTLVQWMVGGFLLLVGVPFWIWAFRRNCVLSPVVSVEKSGWFGKKIVYTDRRGPIHENMAILYGICFIVYLGCVTAITFAH